VYADADVVDHRQPIALSCVNQIRALRLAELIAYPCVDESSGPDIFTVLRDFKPTKIDGLNCWLLDGGSTAILSPEREHVLAPEPCSMTLKGVGEAIATTKSQGVLTTMDHQGLWNTMQFLTVYNLSPNTFDDHSVCRLPHNRPWSALDTSDQQVSLELPLSTLHLSTRLTFT
jgi:hypothetical protein